MISFDVECLQEYELQKIGSDNIKREPWIRI